MKTALVTGTGCDIGKAVDKRNIPYSNYLADFSIIEDVIVMSDSIIQRVVPLYGKYGS